MPKAETRPEAKERERQESVKPPDSLPDGTPLERMAELTRRIVLVPKIEAIEPKASH